MTGRRIAVVGCGQIADAHIQEARKIEGVEVVAVCDSNIHMAQQAALRLGVPGAHTDLAHMLTKERPDVVHITTPPATHLPIAKSALAQGAHVYVEKPLTLDVQQADELFECAERYGKLVCVGHNYAFDAPMRRLRERVQSGRLGEVVHIEAMMGYDLSGAFGGVIMGDAQHWVHGLPGGLPQNNISHPLSLAVPFLGDAQPTVTAVGKRLRQQRYGDVRDAWFDEIRVLLHAGKVSAAITFSCQMRPVQMAITVYGTQQHVHASLESRTLRTTAAASAPGPFRRLQLARRESVEASSEFRARVGDFLHSRLQYFEGMTELLRRFYAATQGAGPAPIPMHEARRVSWLIDEIIARCKAAEQAS
jgi:predicted dehydrogenase